MDRAAFERAGGWLGNAAATGIEFTMAGLSFVVEDGPLGMAWDGGAFAMRIDGAEQSWPGRAVLKAGMVVEVTPGARGNYGYLRFDGEVDVPVVMGSRATSSIAGLGGFHGRGAGGGGCAGLRAGAGAGDGAASAGDSGRGRADPGGVGHSCRCVRWRGAAALRFGGFVVTPQLDRMGVRLGDKAGVFAGQRILSLVSDAVVPGDVQILGDGTPIVLMRDHQPTGGYPRIATIVSADLDRFAQLRPGAEVRFEPVTIAHARMLK